MHSRTSKFHRDANQFQNHSPSAKLSTLTGKIHVAAATFLHSLLARQKLGFDPRIVATMPRCNRTLLVSLLLPLALFGCASGDASPSGEDSTVAGSGGGSATSGNSQTTGGQNGSGDLSSGGSETTGGTTAGDGGSAPTGGATTGGANSGGMGSGGESTGGSGTGGMGNEPEFNPCPTNGEPCKILPLGDSITFGVGSTDEGGYRSRLFGLTVASDQKITFTGSQSTGPAQVAGVTFPKNHEGRSGWTIDPGFSTWAGGISSLVPNPAFNTKPHIVLLMIGTNDVNAAQGQNTMTDRLESLLDKIIQAAPDALIVLAQITPLGWSPQALSNYNAKLPNIVNTRAASGQHLLLVDMSKMPLSGLDGDSIHPNNQGYDFMAKVWHDAIKEFLPQE